MGEMVIFDNDTATIMGGQFTEPQDIVIHCDLCNEPLAITPEPYDQVFITCLRCHAVSHIPISIIKEANDESPQE
jgi:CRISPR/Cas system-associated protein Cas10 (large subunit of type III CRISPR-Cas system)